MGRLRVSPGGRRADSALGLRERGWGSCRRPTVSAWPRDPSRGTGRVSARASPHVGTQAAAPAYSRSPPTRSSSGGVGPRSRRPTQKFGSLTQWGGQLLADKARSPRPDPRPRARAPETLSPPQRSHAVLRGASTGCPVQRTETGTREGAPPRRAPRLRTQRPGWEWRPGRGAGGGGGQDDPV